MPLPILQSKPSSTSVAKSRYKIFVSYSHKNSTEVRQFIEDLKSAISASPDVGISPDQVFFDREKLLAGDPWAESIHQAMDEAQYFLILLTEDSLSSESFCSHELATAVARGLPVIPILLSRCNWENKSIPNDILRRKLSDFEVLPKDDKSNCLPIAEWPEERRVEVWKRVIGDVLKRLQRDKAVLQNQLSVLREMSWRSEQRRVPPVQYFCDQKIPVKQFDGAVQGWKDKALLVLARGVSQDEVPRFWDRLQYKNLKDYVKARQEELLPDRPFLWTEIIDQQADREALRAQMLRVMSEALTRNMYEVSDPSSLGTRLSALSGIQPFVATLSDLPIEAIRLGLRVLLDLLEECSDEAPMHRLVIALLLEDSTFVQEAALEARLSLNGYQRTNVVILDPLQPIEYKDVSLWHRNYEVKRLYNIEEDKLLQGVFGEEPGKTMRLREFAKKVAPFIREIERTL